jgi:2-iminobutanoate/2-iminopropanoate deaminase
MARETIHTDGAPSSPLYAQGVRAGDTIHVSGMVGLDVSTSRLAGETVGEQLRQAVANCAAVLAAGGASLDDVVEVGILLTEPEDFPALNAAWAELFPVDPPARYVAKLGVSLPGIRVSVRMTAWAPTAAGT